MGLGSHRDSFLNLQKGQVKHDTALDDITTGNETWESSDFGDGLDEDFGFVDLDNDVDCVLSQEEPPLIEPPQHKQETSVKSGFSNDYDDVYQSSYYDPYSLFDEHGNPQEEGIFCCVFPWNQNNEKLNVESEKEASVSEENENSSTLKKNLSIASSESDESQLDTENESSSVKSCAEENSGKGSPLLVKNDVPKEVKSEECSVVDNDVPAQEPKLKSIIKTNNSMPSEEAMKKEKNSSSSLSTASNKSTGGVATDQRRHLFVSSYDSYKDRSTEERVVGKKHHRVTFAPMAKVSTVPALSDIPPFIRFAIWWSKHDYAEFKKTGRIIAKAMLEGGSEIWLSSRTLEKEAGLGGEDFGEKWWCKFGHSRRGLEHITRMEEGLFRHRSVSNATQAVLREQRRQRMGRCEDDKKLSLISLQYTSWARDLSLAAGHADEEAVRSKFSDRASDKQRMNLRGKVIDGLRKNNFSAPPVSQDTLEMVSKLDAHTYTSILARFHDENNSQNAPSNLQSSIAKKAAAFGRAEGGTDMVDFNSLARTNGRSLEVQ